LEATLTGHKGTVNTLSLLSESLLVSGGFDRTIQLWDINEKKRLRVVCTSSASIRQLHAISESYFVSVSSDKLARLWELSMNQCVAKYSGHVGEVMSVDMIGDTIVTGSKDKTVRIWQ
jgi:WD40 repeat protein